MSHGKFLSLRARREREMTLTLRMTGMTSTVQSVRPKEGHSGSISLKTAELLQNSRKRNKEFSRNPRDYINDRGGKKKRGEGHMLRDFADEPEECLLSLSFVLGFLSK